MPLKLPTISFSPYSRGRLVPSNLRCSTDTPRILIFRILDKLITSNFSLSVQKQTCSNVYEHPIRSVASDSAPLILIQRSPSGNSALPLLTALTNLWRALSRYGVLPYGMLDGVVEVQWCSDSIDSLISIQTNDDTLSTNDNKKSQFLWQCGISESLISEKVLHRIPEFVFSWSIYSRFTAVGN